MIKECHETVSSLGTGSEQAVAETSDLFSGSLQCLFYISADGFTLCLLSPFELLAELLWKVLFDM